MMTDAIYNEIRELKKDLQSLSPKLQIYQTTLKRYQELQELVGDQGEIPGKKKNKKWHKGHRY